VGLPFLRGAGGVPAELPCRTPAVFAAVPRERKLEPPVGRPRAAVPFADGPGRAAAPDFRAAPGRAVGPDFAAPPGWAVAPDLTTVPDLTEAPDLPPAPVAADLATPPDLESAADFDLLVVPVPALGLPSALALEAEVSAARRWVLVSLAD